MSDQTPDAKLAELLNPAPTEPKPAQPPPPIVLDPGIHVLERPEYDRVQAINISTLAELDRSPAHYKAALEQRALGSAPETDELRVGRATHLAIFEPKVFDSHVVRWTGKARDDRHKDWQAFQAEHRGQLILTAAGYEQVIALSAAARRHPVVKEYLRDGTSEVTVRWDQKQKPEAGRPGYAFECKGRVDHLNPLAVFDVKTAVDASFEGFTRAAWNLRYPAKAAWYRDGCRAATKQDRPFIFIVIEKSYPHVVGVFRLGKQAYQLGRDKYLEWLEQLAQCQRSNHWPPYFEGEAELEPPAWVQRQLMEVA